MDDTMITQPASSTSAPSGGAVAKAPSIATPRAALDDSLSHRARSEWRRLRRSFTLENLKQFAKTLIWVVPLTVMIWIYAEQEQIAQDANVQIHVRLVPSDANQVLQNMQPAGGDFTIDLQGPRAALDRVEANLRGSVAQIPINGSRIDPDGKPVKVSAAEQIGNYDVLVKNGVNVLRSIPEFIQFNMDQLVTADAEVRVPAGLNLEGSTFDPPKVQIRGPQKLIQSTRDSEKGLWVTADLAALVGQKKPGGPYTVPDVPLLKPVDDPDLTLLTTRVTAQVIKGATDITKNIGARPIWLSTPLAFPADKSWVDLGENKATKVGDVTVSGPVEKVNLLNDPDVLAELHAEVAIPSINPPQGTATLRYVGLPPGVTVISDEDGGQIKYKIVDR